MKYTDATAFRQALEARLRTRSGSDGSLVARNRNRVAFDRPLARLVLVAPQRWRLKGGFALELRFAERARATKDVDIEWHGDGEELLTRSSTSPTAIAALKPVDAATVRVAIETTFDTRATHLPPDLLPEPPADWTTQYRRLANQGTSPDLAARHALAAALLNPVLVGSMRQGTWDPETGAWTAE